MRKNLTNAEIVPAALRGEDAVTKTGAFSTDSYREGFSRYGAPYHGQLPKVWRRHLDARFRAGAISQVIYSYSTPIAWRDSEHGWIIPRVSYSATTSSKHQTHLYRLHGAHIGVPWDATDSDLDRVMAGLMVFATNRRGEYVGTLPGVNYAPEGA